MRELLVTRHGVVFDGEWTGPHLEIPAAPCAVDLELSDDTPQEEWDVLGDVDALPTRLGLEREIPSFGGVESLRLWGLHEPSRWEGRVVTWLAERLAVPNPLADQSTSEDGPFAEFAQRVSQLVVPWPEAPPTGLGLLRGQDPDLEALGGTRWLRRQLMEQPRERWADWLDQVLVLTPNDPTRIELWRRRLEQAGLPVRTRLWSSLTETVLGRWLLALARLSGGATRPVRRSDLVAVLEAPVYTMVTGGRRADLRRIVRDLRRPEIDFALFARHVDAWFERRVKDLDPESDSFEEDRADLGARCQAVQTLLAWIVEAVGPRGQAGLWRRLLQLMDRQHLAVQSRLGGTGDADLLAAMAVARDQLELLAVGDPVPNQEPHAVLAEALASAGLRVRSGVARGLRLQSWEHWDGQAATVALLTGLEEGGFPPGVAPKSLLDQRLIEAAALDTPAQLLERQGRLLAHALRSTSQRVLMSWSEADGEGSASFPGALLAGMPEKDGRPKGSWATISEAVTERSLLPDDWAGAWSGFDLRILPCPDEIEDEAWEKAESTARHDAEVRAARAPSQTDVTPGPWSGVIGAPVPPKRWAPTTLEDLGQCPLKFLQGRLLRAERDEDSDSMLDPRELGTLVHDALAKAALDAIERDGAWRLQPPTGDDDREAWVCLRAEELAAASAGLVDRYTELNPTLGKGIADWTAARWQRALRLALANEAGQTRGGQLGQTAPDAADLDADQLAVVRGFLTNKDDRKKVDDYLEARELAERAHRLIDALVEANPTKKPQAVEIAEQHGLSSLKKVLTKGTVQKSCTKQGVNAAVIEDFVAGKLAAQAAQVQPLVTSAFYKDRRAVPRDVIAAEWSFGFQREAELQAGTSLDTPLLIQFDDQRSIELKGRVDRIDGDPSTARLAAVDYKTGV